jgi:hypothetical protein
MKATLIALAITLALLLCLRRRRDADNEAIRTIQRWRNGL